MTTNHVIGKYRVYYYTKRSSESDPIAKICLFNDQEQYVGYIRFFKEGISVPDNYITFSSTMIRVFLMASENQLYRIVDILRNEKPCTVYYSSPTNAMVYTGSEPVGEEETA